MKVPRVVSVQFSAAAPTRPGGSVSDAYAGSPAQRICQAGLQTGPRLELLRVPRAVRARSSALAPAPEGSGHDGCGCTADRTTSRIRRGFDVPRPRFPTGSRVISNARLRRPGVVVVKLTQRPLCGVGPVLGGAGRSCPTRNSRSSWRRSLGPRRTRELIASLHGGRRRPRAPGLPPDEQRRERVVEVGRGDDVASSHWALPHC